MALTFVIDPSITGRKRERLDALVAAFHKGNTFDFPGEVNLGFTSALKNPHYDPVPNTIFLPSSLFTKWRLSGIRTKARTLLHECFHYYDIKHMGYEDRAAFFKMMFAVEPQNDKPDLYPYPWAKRDGEFVAVWVNNGGDPMKWPFRWQDRGVEKFAATAENTYWRDTTEAEWRNTAGACNFAVRPVDRRAEFKALMEGASV